MNNSTENSNSAITNVSFQLKKKKSFKRKYGNTLQEVPYDNKKLASVSIFLKRDASTDEIAQLKANLELLKDHLDWKGEITQKDCTSKDGVAGIVIGLNKFAKRIIPSMEDNQAFFSSLFGNAKI